MSDTRDDAEQEMVNAGISSGLEDSLGSSLSGSFAPPSMKPEPAPAPTGAAAISKSEEAQEETPPVPGMAEWKDTYDSYLSEWQAESSIARQKSEEVRKRIEEEAAAKEKAAADEIKAKKRAEQEAEKRKEIDAKLKLELEQSSGSKKSALAKRRADLGREDRERSVKEAWEMVKGAGEGKQGEEVVTDGRGVTDADIRAGNVEIDGQKKESTKSHGYDSATSKDPLPPSMRDQPPSPTLPMPSSSQTLSRHSATSQAWTEVSGNTSSAEDLSPPRSGSSDEAPEPRQTDTNLEKSEESQSQVPARIPNQIQSQPQNQNTPPSQPPSLTLSLFTSPSSVSYSKIFAIVGINIILPFINGVMLGFGEIFAREAVKTGRHWWRTGTGLFGRRGGSGLGGRGTSGAGLSGSGGF